MPYVVETPVYDEVSKRGGTFRHWVATEEKAKEEAAKCPGRTYRYVTEAEMHPAARANLTRET